MQVATITRVLRAYGVESTDIAAAQSGYRSMAHAITKTDGTVDNLVFYKVEPGIATKIRQANRVGDALAVAGLPTRQTRDRRILKLAAGEYEVYASLYNYLPGETIAWEAYTRDHIKLVGKALARLHRAAKDLPQAGAVEVRDVNERLLAEMKTYFADTGVQRAMTGALHLKLDLDSLNATRFADLPHKQMLHMDFVRGNLLFAPANPDDADLQEGNVRLTGILDFEKASYGSPLYDIARTLAFLLVDCKYKTARQVTRYFLRSGYIKRGGGSIDDMATLGDLVKFYLLYDVYKFLRHNVYEGLAHNEHYIRTRDMLLKNYLLVSA